MKDPITSSAKRSKAGRMKLIKVDSLFKTVEINEPYCNNILEEVFYNGTLTREQDIEHIRELAKV